MYSAPLKRRPTDADASSRRLATFLPAKREDRARTARGESLFSRCGSVRFDCAPAGGRLAWPHRAQQCPQAGGSSSDCDRRGSRRPGGFRRRRPRRGAQRADAVAHTGRQPRHRGSAASLLMTKPKGSLAPIHRAAREPLWPTESDGGDRQAHPLQSDLPEGARALDGSHDGVHSTTSGRALPVSRGSAGRAGPARTLPCAAHVWVSATCSSWPRVTRSAHTCCPDGSPRFRLQARAVLPQLTTFTIYQSQPRDTQMGSSPEVKPSAMPNAQVPGSALSYVAGQRPACGRPFWRRTDILF